MIEPIKNDNWDAALRAPVAVVDFYADWCGPCRMLSPIMKELSEEFPDISFFKVNTDENTRLSFENNISSIPTVLLLKNGEIADRFIGYMPKEDVRAFLLS